MSDRKQGAEARGKKRASAQGKTTRGSSRRGEGSPKAGSPQPGQTGDALAIPNLPEIPSFLEPSKDSSGPPADSEEGDYPEFATDAGSLSTAFPEIGVTLPEVKRYRLPPMKTVGRDADGKVIPHVRSEETAKLVAHLVGTGSEINFICAAINIRPGQLKVLYSAELEHGKALADAEVQMAAHAMAKSGLNGEMTRFWLKSRAGWSDKDKQVEDNLFNIHIHA